MTNPVANLIKLFANKIKLFAHYEIPFAQLTNPVANWIKLFANWIKLFAHYELPVAQLTNLVANRIKLFENWIKLFAHYELLVANRNSPFKKMHEALVNPFIADFIGEGETQRILSHWLCPRLNSLVRHCFLQSGTL